MKQSRMLLALILPLVLIAGCAGTAGQPGSPATRSTGEIIDDTAITTKVKAALLADADVKSLKISVDTKDGEVKLKGEVKTLVLRKKVESIVRGIGGVKSVNNQLVITG